MQGKVGAPPKEILTTAAMETPDKKREEVLEETINDWVNHVSKTGRKAPEGYIAQRILAHNLRQLAENKLEKGGANIGKFKCLNKGNRVSPCVTPPPPQRQIFKPRFSPSTDGDRSGDGGDFNNVVAGSNGRGN